jgi:hypothetical protein
MLLLSQVEGAEGMEKLVKPVDYAKSIGISRQAVYMKIKKGVLPSRTVEGKIYVVVEDEEGGGPSVPDEKMEREKESDSAPRFEELLHAKDETIAVLKETVRDLKETNRMITSTLRSEVELLKEAFSEMKTLYAAQIEHMRAEETIDTEAESENLLPNSPEEDESTKEAEIGQWLTLGEFSGIYGMKKKRLKALKKRLKKLSAKDDESVRIVDGEYYISDSSIVEKLIKDL